MHFLILFSICLTWCRPMSSPGQLAIATVVCSHHKQQSSDRPTRSCRPGYGPCPHLRHYNKDKRSEVITNNEVATVQAAG